MSVNGPFEFDIYNNITIFWSTLLTELDEGEELKQTRDTLERPHGMLNALVPLLAEKLQIKCKVLCTIVERLSTKDSNNLVC